MHNLRTDSLYFFASYTLWSKLYHETFVGHEGLAMGFLVVAISKSKVIDFVAAVADAFGKGDVSVLDQSVEFFIVELVKLVKRFDCLIIDDPDTLVDGVFDAVFRRPATAAGIEDTEGKDEAESETKAVITKSSPE